MKRAVKIPLLALGTVTYNAGSLSYTRWGPILRNRMHAGHNNVPLPFKRRIHELHRLELSPDVNAHQQRGGCQRENDSPRDDRSTNEGMSTRKRLKSKGSLAVFT